MIRLSIRGLAKYMTSSPAGQRKVLRDYKYPDEDEPSAMRRYYKDATDRIRVYHRPGHEPSWLRAKVLELSELARLTPGRAGAKLRHNARALAAYEKHFAGRSLLPLPNLRLRLDIGNVVIGVSPDLHAIERKKAKLLKFDFSVAAPSDDMIKIVSQVMFEAAKGSVADLTSSSIEYVDVTRGNEFRGARAGARTLREIEAACATIENVWASI
jgi:hypothetical protein